MKCPECCDNSIELNKWIMKRKVYYCPSCGRGFKIEIRYKDNEGKERTDNFWQITAASKTAIGYIGSFPILEGGIAKSEKGEVRSNVRLRLLFPEGKSVMYEEENAVEISEELMKEIEKL